MSTRPLRFLHISDLHFRAGPGRTGTLHDLDSVLRRAVLDDVREQVERGHTIDGILVSGDVGFAGKPADYELALKWFAALATTAGCDRAAVWMVPGNHDVDRSVVQDSKALISLRKELRTCDRQEIDDILRQWLTGSDGALVLKPLDAYIDFSAKFGCRVTASLPYWEKFNKLNDGWMLRVRGMTSPLISDSSDSDEANKLVLGRMQCIEMPQDGVVTLMMCHHPMEWLRDGSAVGDVITNHAPVQLYGHIHRERVQVHGPSLRLVAGALQPERGEGGWNPGYNYLGLQMGSTSGVPHLLVDVESRVWNEMGQRFVPGVVGDALGAGPRQYALPVRARPPVRPADDIGPGAAHLTLAPVSPATQLQSGHSTEPDAIDHGERGNTAALLKQADMTMFLVDGAPSASEARAVNPIQALLYRYLTLPHRHRATVAQVLDLVRDEDDGVRDAELASLYFERASTSGRLADLWHEVEIRHADATPTSINPFAPESRGDES